MRWMRSCFHLPPPTQNIYYVTDAGIAKTHYIDVIMTAMASQITSLTVVYSTVYSDADQRKHQSSTSLAFVWGSHRDRWIPRTKGQLRGKCFHLMTSSWIGKVHKNGSVFNFITCPIWFGLLKCPFDTYYLPVYLTLFQYDYHCNFYYYIWLHICVWIIECMGVICQPVGFDAKKITQILFCLIAILFLD